MAKRNKIKDNRVWKQIIRDEGFSFFSYYTSNCKNTIQKDKDNFRERRKS